MMNIYYKHKYLKINTSGHGQVRKNNSKLYNKPIHIFTSNYNKLSIENYLKKNSEKIILLWSFQIKDEINTCSKLSGEILLLLIFYIGYTILSQTDLHNQNVLCRLFSVEKLRK